MSGTSLWVLDLPRLAAAVDAVIRHRGITAKDAARETGLSPSTLTRISQGQKPDADALVTILAWLRADVSQFASKREAAP